MSKSNSMTITFDDNPNEIFTINQILSGSVELKVVKLLKKVRGLRITVKGKAECRWQERRYSSNQGTTQLFYGKEEIISSEWFLFGSKDGQTFDIPTGVYNYKFSQHLPPQIPYSVKSYHGEISYKITAELDIEWARDLIAQRPFTVMRYEDLNMFPDLRIPHEIEKLKTFCCFPCRSKPLLIYLTIPRRGFALGQEIPVEVQLINKSSTPVKQAMLALKRTESHVSKYPYKKVLKIYKKIARVNSRVKAGDITTFTMNLEVPRSALQSNDRYCGIYQITYELKFKALIEGFHFSPKVYVPITIGSIGIR